MPRTSKAAIVASLTLCCMAAAPQHAIAAQTLPFERPEFVAVNSTPAGRSPFATRLPRQERFQVLTRNIWVKAGDATSVAIKIFLPSGTLVQDSCGGINRLSAWRMDYDGSLTWNEDGTDIKADILRLSDHELVLAVKFGGGDVEESYAAALVPSVLCPDTPKR